MIDLRLAQLRSFVAVVDRGGFGAAAVALELGQSAVSQHVRRLEDAIGTELLTRTSRRVALTPAGERLIESARHALRDLDHAAAEARAVAAGHLGTLRIAAQQAARGRILPGVIAHLTDHAPQLTLEVWATTTAEGLDGVREGRFDVALVRDPDPRSGIDTEVLVTDPLMIVLPVGHRLAGRDVLPLSALRGEPRVGWSRHGAPDFHDRITEVLVDAEVDPAPRLTLFGVDVRLGAVAAGLGYALESSAYAWILRDRVVFVPIKGEPLRGAIAAAWSAVRPVPALGAFLTAARIVASGRTQPSSSASAAAAVTGVRQANPSHT